MRRLTPEEIHRPDGAMTMGADVGAEDVQRTLVLIGLGYLGLVGIAFYLDYKIQMRRARKRHEREDRKET